MSHELRLPPNFYPALSADELPNHSRSAANGGTSLLLGQFEEAGLNGGEQPRRNEAVTESVYRSWDWRHPGVRPFVDVVFRYDDPARSCIEAERLFDRRRTLDADRLSGRRRMGDW